MASKGVTKTGEAFCMACGAGLEPGAERCESCYSQLDEEVKDLISERAETVRGILLTHRTVLDAIAGDLLKKEVMESDDLYSHLNSYKQDSVR